MPLLNENEFALIGVIILNGMYIMNKNMRVHKYLSPLYLKF